MSNSTYINRLIKLSQEKKNLLNEMLLITQEQKTIIVEQAIDQLNNLIDEKQNRINSINSLDDQFEQIFSNMKTELKINDIGELLVLKNPEAIELKKTISDIMTLINHIKNVEMENALKLNQQKKEIGKKLQDLKKNRLAVNKFYNSKSYLPPNPTFIDKKK